MNDPVAKILLSLYRLAQSICTHHSNLSGQPDIFLGSGTLKKIRSTKKQGAKKQGHCYSKKDAEGWPLLFLNNNDSVFLHPAFFGPYFFSGSQTDPCF